MLSAIVPKKCTGTLIKRNNNNYTKSSPTFSQRRTIFVLTDEKDNNKREKIVILGTGWAAFRIVRTLNVEKYKVVVVSPRNHFLFTPLLPATSTGTLEFRSIIEPIRNSQTMKHVRYYQAACTSFNLDNNKIECEGTVTQQKFEVDYDKLIIAVGAQCNTFNIEGVTENALFLKELADSRKIRNRIIECFEQASIPTLSTEERKRILNTVIVGGGPTGVEFAGELSDFFWHDLRRCFPNIPINEVKITVLEASHNILSAFDKRLVERALTNLKKLSVDIRTDTVVKQVKPGEVILADGTSVPYGTLIWTTGIAPRKVIQNSPFLKERGRIVIDEFLKVKGYDNIYALGDCANIEGQNLSATAQVAQQQGKYLSDTFNAQLAGKPVKPFVYHFLGLMTYVGGFNSLIDTPKIKSSGFVTWIAWRSAYLTRLGTLKNKFQVPFDWMRTIVFGRDVTSF